MRYRRRRSLRRYDRGRMTDTSQPVDRIAHVADIHFWRIVRNPLRMLNKRFLGNLTVLFRRRHEFVLERAEPFADAIAQTGVKTVVLTGDFSSTSLDEEFELAVGFVRGLRDRGLAVHLMPGNHDVYTFDAWRKKRFEHFFAEFLPQEGYPAVATLPGGTSLVMVPTVCPRHFSARGLIIPDTIEAVRGLLKSCAPAAIVAAHYPVLPKTHGYASNPFRRLQNAEAFRDMLGASGKRILYLCGHVHRYSHERDSRYPMIEHVSTGAFFRMDRATGIKGEFTEVRVYAETFKMERRTFEE
jgi:hypothetical protein